MAGARKQASASVQRMLHDATEKARVELLESLLNAAPVEEEGAEEGVEEEKGA